MAANPAAARWAGTRRSRRPGPGRRPRTRAHGFTYLGVLLLLALLGALLAGVGVRASQQAQRERERELLFRAGQIRAAIAAYRAATPATPAAPAAPAAPRWPPSLQDLLADRRSGITVHHLRQLYADPFSGKPDWVLLHATPGDATTAASAPSTPAAAPAAAANEAGAATEPADDGIVGLRSRSPLRRLLRDETGTPGVVAAGSRVSDWVFMAEDAAPAAVAVPAGR